MRRADRVGADRGRPGADCPRDDWRRSPLLNVQSAIGLALFACATNLLIGYGGLVSFGQGAFYGIGAYVVALAWLHCTRRSGSASSRAPSSAAWRRSLVGLLALRTRRLYFALLTLAVSQLLYVIVEQQDEVHRRAPTACSARCCRASWPTGQRLLVHARGRGSSRLLVLWQITRSPFGMTLRAIRENRERAEALGVNVLPAPAAGVRDLRRLLRPGRVLFVVLRPVGQPGPAQLDAVRLSDLHGGARRPVHLPRARRSAR